jgi:hypothetical protein
MYKVGDKVKIIFEEHEKYGKIGKIVGVVNYKKSQFPRVSFSSNLFDYIDIGSWKIKKVDSK